MYLHVCVGMCMEVQLLAETREGFRFPGTGVTSHQTWMLRTELQSSLRAVHIFLPQSCFSSPLISISSVWMYSVGVCIHVYVIYSLDMAAIQFLCMKLPCHEYSSLSRQECLYFTRVVSEIRLSPVVSGMVKCLNSSWQYV